MCVTKEQMIERFSTAILEGHAALFAGAGLSAPSGFVSWKELIRSFADDVHLSIDKEHDYLAVAQYYYNEHGRNKNVFARAILDNFAHSQKENTAVDIVTRLPIRTYWTTNYDALIEDGLRKSNRRPDVKRSEADLPINLGDSDAVVYKMHGDITAPIDAVLLKDDYETYEQKRSLFKTALCGDLVSKTFLFIGFSFEDPNLSAIMGRIKSLLGDNVRTHYCLFAKAIKEGNETDDDFEYRKQKQMLVSHDLQRYGIETVFLDSYSEIPDLLRTIEIRISKHNVFISGSYSKEDTSWSFGDASSLAQAIAQHCIEGNKRITSGYGLGIGSAVIIGAMEALKKKRFTTIDEYLRLYPFPQPVSGENVKQLWTDYRKAIMADCGSVVFLFGNKLDKDGNVVNANGMVEEFEIAIEQGKRIIPVSSTGYAAKYIYERMIKEREKYPYLEKHWEALAAETNVTKIATLVLKIIKEE